MNALLVVALASSPMLYEAQVPTFGCTSGLEVAKLQAVRSDAHAFGQLFTSQVAYGQCVTIPRGAVVDGIVSGADGATLLVNARLDPPGYIVPATDFKPKAVDPGE
jgi:hypothetical protein